MSEALTTFYHVFELGSGDSRQCLPEKYDITNTSEALLNFLVIKINIALKSSKHREILCKNGANDLNLFTTHYFDSKTL